MTWAAALDAALTVERDTFPQAVTYTPEGGAAASIVGIFDEAHEGTEFDADGLAVLTTRPVLWVKLDDMAQAPHVRDTAVIGATTYEVTSTQADGSGGMDLYLVEVG
jgi:hypothetical protein